MAVNKISMGINYRKKTNSRMTGSGNYFAEVDRRETLTTRGLAEHLKEHGCLAGLDAIQAVLVKVSQCVPELVAQGIGVKLDGLGIFYPTIKNKKGGATETQMLDKDYNPTSLIEGVHVRFSPESTDLDNLTSKQFLTRRSVPSMARRARFALWSASKISAILMEASPPAPLQRARGVETQEAVTAAAVTTTEAATATTTLTRIERRLKAEG